MPEFEGDDTGTNILVVAPDLGGRSAEQAMRFVAESVTWHLWPKLTPPPGQAAMDIHVSWNGEPVTIPKPEDRPPLHGFAQAFQSPPRRAVRPTPPSASAWTRSAAARPKATWASWRQSHSSTGSGSTSTTARTLRTARRRSRRPRSRASATTSHSSGHRSSSSTTSKGHHRPRAGPSGRRVPCRRRTGRSLRRGRATDARLVEPRAPPEEFRDAPSSTSASARSGRPSRTDGRPARSRRTRTSQARRWSPMSWHTSSAPSTAAAKVDDARTPSPSKPGVRQAEDRLHLLRTHRAGRAGWARSPRLRVSPAPRLEGDHPPIQRRSGPRRHPRPTRTSTRDLSFVEVRVAGRARRGRRQDRSR